jgi:hypothetical protein
LSSPERLEVTVSRRVRPFRFLAAVAIAAMWLVPAPSVLGANDPIVLNKATTGGPGIPGSGGNYDQTFAAIEIRGSYIANNGQYSLYVADSGIPLAWEYYAGNIVHGTGAFSMSGTYDPKTAAVSGTFSYQNTATGTIKGSVGNLALDFSMTWDGNVTGSIVGTVATLRFAGAYSSKCTMGGDNCGQSGTQSQTVWFTVSGMSTATVAGDTGENVVVVSGAEGEVYLSPASEVDLEPAQRTWTALKPGDRVALNRGVMLRTGKAGTLRVDFADTSHLRLGNSTLFVIKTVTTSPTMAVLEMTSRLIDGVMEMYLKKQREESRKFEFEVDRAIVTIKGTEFRLETGDAADVLTVIDGTVQVTAKATGEYVAVAAGQQATIADSGVSVAPAGAAAASISVTPGTTGEGGASPLAPGGWPAGGGSPVVTYLALGGAAAAMALAAIYLWSRSRAS